MRRALAVAGAAVAGVLVWLWHDAGKRVRDVPPCPWHDRAAVGRHRIPFEHAYDDDRWWT